MSVAKELLLSCIVMMHISFMASRGLEPCTLGKEESCRSEWKTMVVPLCHLLRAENAYVKHILNGHPPKTNPSKPMEIITLPVRNNTKEIQDSVCAISRYLDKHLPVIVRSLAPAHQDIINDTNVFHRNFIAAVRKTNINQHTQLCNTSVTTSHDYSKKLIGYWIIYYSRRWVEGFIGTNSSCNGNPPHF